MRCLALTVALATALLGGRPVSAAGTTLFGLVDTGELDKSTDQGINWAAVSTLPVRDAVALGAGVNSAELYLPSRSDQNWTALGTLTGSDFVSLAETLPDRNLCRHRPPALHPCQGVDP